MPDVPQDYTYFVVVFWNGTEPSSPQLAQAPPPDTVGRLQATAPAEVGGRVSTAEPLAPFAALTDAITTITTLEDSGPVANSSVQTTTLSNPDTAGHSRSLLLERSLHTQLDEEQFNETDDAFASLLALDEESNDSGPSLFDEDEVGLDALKSERESLEAALATLGDPSEPSVELSPKRNSQQPAKPGDAPKTESTEDALAERPQAKDQSRASFTAGMVLLEPAGDPNIGDNSLLRDVLAASIEDTNPRAEIDLPLGIHQSMEVGATLNSNATSSATQSSPGSNPSGPALTGSPTSRMEPT